MVAGRRLPLGASLGGSGDARCSVIERKRKRKRRRRSEEEKEEGGAKKKKKTHPPYTTLTPDRPSPDGPSMLLVNFEFNWILLSGWSHTETASAEF